MSTILPRIDISSSSGDSLPSATGSVSSSSVDETSEATAADDKFCSQCGNNLELMKHNKKSVKRKRRTVKLLTKKKRKITTNNKRKPTKKKDKKKKKQKKK
jgi:hypothetical protein